VARVNALASAPFRLTLSVFIVVVLSNLPASAYELGHEFLPPDHWAYRALERFETLGLVGLPSEKPYTRRDVARYVADVKGGLANAGLSLPRRDRFELERLESEFIDSTSREDPKHRYDPPLVSLRDEPLHAEADLQLGLAPRKELFNDKWDVFGLAAPLSGVSATGYAREVERLFRRVRKTRPAMATLDAVAARLAYEFGKVEPASSTAAYEALARLRLPLITHTGEVYACSNTHSRYSGRFSIPRADAALSR